MIIDTQSQPLKDRIEKALADFTSGRASMHVPPLDTDVDVVLAECSSALEAAEKRIAELEARPASAINFKENADADFCRKWAWEEVKKELAPEAWAAGDNFNYYGFFCWGWDSRRQYNEQRAAGISVKGE